MKTLFSISVSYETLEIYLCFQNYLFFLLIQIYLGVLSVIYQLDPE